MKMIFLVVSMITVLMLFGACTTPSDPVGTSLTATTPSAPVSAVTIQAPTFTATPSPVFTPVPAPTPFDPTSTSPTPTAQIAPTPEVAVLTAAATPTSSPEITQVTEDASNETDEKIFADVTDVSARGPDGTYSFSVTISSPDTGCTQYADWWEVLSEEGDLIYWRVLAHSHTEEQPFQRSGSPVEIEPGQTVIVRAHMNASGYGGVAMRGTVDEGFEEVTLESAFAADAESQGPLPESCAF